MEKLCFIINPIKDKTLIKNLNHLKTLIMYDKGNMVNHYLRQITLL